MIEKHLIKNVSSTCAKKLYGKNMTDQLENLIGILHLAKVYELKKLKIECILSLAAHFGKKNLEQNTLFSKLDQDLKLEIFSKRVDNLETKLEQNEAKLKHLQDENLKQKFEIKRLESQS